MEKYPKLFIKAGIYYLIVGVLIGVLMGTQLMISAGLRFVHIHANLFGFMAMTIFGVSYHILPRFNGRPVRYPSWIPVQFYLMNVSLIGILVFYMLGGYWEPGTNIKSISLGLFSVTAGVSIVMFSINMLSVLVEQKPEVVSASSPPPQENKIPSSVPVSGPASPSTFNVPQTTPVPDIGSGKGIKKGEKCNADVMIGKLLETYPETRIVFAKHYGESCFTCPGQEYETVAQTASMHSMDVNIILKEINEEIEKVIKTT